MRHAHTYTTQIPIDVKHLGVDMRPLAHVCVLVQRVCMCRLCWYAYISAHTSQVPIDVKDLGVDMLTVAGHKLYAPAGRHVC